MGYTTTFQGKLTFNRALTVQEMNWYKQFVDHAGDDYRLFIDDYGGYVQWEVFDDGKYLAWDGGEKFYIPWLKVVIDQVLSPWGIVVNGELEWDGEESGVGLISVNNNEITIKRLKKVWVEDEDEEDN